jgi:glycerophosphoryl diester phosphodiesterase
MERMLIYGHRGASAHVRQNTVEAYALAVAQGADGVELDVRRSRDGVLVIDHDDRTAPDATPLVELDFREIRATTPWVPTLDEAWEALGPDTLLNIEIKNTPGQADYDPTHRVGTAVARWIEAHETDDRILVTSLNALTIAAVKAGSSVPTGLVVTAWLDPVLAIQEGMKSGDAAVSLSLEATLPDAPRIVEAAGDLDVLVWTVNDPEQGAVLADGGVAGIFTDDPGLMIEALSDRS